MKTIYLKLLLAAVFPVFLACWAEDLKMIDPLESVRKIPNRMPIPGLIEAEDYARGGEGRGYHDTTEGNEGGVYRNDDVDIEECVEGGYHVGWIDKGEWLAFRTRVKKTAEYDIEFRVAREWYAVDSYIHLEFRGNDITGPIFVPDTGGFHTWESVTVKNIRLPRGKRKIKLVFDGSEMNVNWMKFTESGQEPEPPAAPTDLTAEAITQNEITLIWTDNSDNEDGFIVEKALNGEFTEIARVVDATFTDTELKPATAYTYRVQAHNGAGKSVYSNEFEATTLPDTQDEILPEWRKMDWSPGNKDFIYGDVEIDVTAFGAIPNDNIDDTRAFKNAINYLSNGGIIHIPAGTFNLDDTLQIRQSMTLRGTGKDTVLDFDHGPFTGNDLSERIDSLMIGGGPGSPWISVNKDTQKGDSFIEITNPSMFNVGDVIIISEHYSEGQYPGYGVWVKGEMKRITSIDGLFLNLDKPLSIDYNTITHEGTIYRPRVSSIDPITDVAIEDLKIIRSNRAGVGIHFHYAHNCKVINVEIDNAHNKFVYFDTSYMCEVRNSYFKNSPTFDNPGVYDQGYGIDTHWYSSDNLIENNIFYRVKCSIMFHFGGSGNVAAYNYVHNSTWGWGLSIHGMYSFYNLFESNVADGVDMDNYWGENGPCNTILRNKLRVEGIDSSDWYQNILGNILIGRDPTIHEYPGSGGLIAHGNNLDGELVWEPELPKTVPVSYYLKEKPEFFGEKPWPAFNPQYPDSGTIPAQDRFNNGEHIN